jgi:hypothetical protein
VAIGVGIVSGLTLRLFQRFGAHLLGLDYPTPTPERPAQGHSASSYRAARERKRLDEELRKAARSRLLVTAPLLGLAGAGPENRRAQMRPFSPTSPRQKGGLLSTTILEEVDDSAEDYGF